MLLTHRLVVVGYYVHTTCQFVMQRLASHCSSLVHPERRLRCSLNLMELWLAHAM